MATTLFIALAGGLLPEQRRFLPKINKEISEINKMPGLRAELYEEGGEGSLVVLITENGNNKLAFRFDMSVWPFKGFAQTTINNGPQRVFVPASSEHMWKDRETLEEDITFDSFGGTWASLQYLNNPAWEGMGGSHFLSLRQNQESPSNAGPMFFVKDLKEYYDGLLWESIGAVQSPQGAGEGGVEPDYLGMDAWAVQSPKGAGEGVEPDYLGMDAWMK